MSSVDPFSPGATIDRFRLVERNGATVWKAVDANNDRQIALKVLTKQLPRDARRDTLVRDVRLAAALYHPFLVGIQEIAVAGDALLMVMEWFHGEPITNLVHGQPMARPQFFRVAAQIVDAIKFLHLKGIVHGNLNGDSVIIGAEGRVKLGGLNVGNLLRKEGRSSEYQLKGSDLRTVAYMAPEQITGQPIDERADIFSLGSLLYEMSTGALPFAGKTAPDMARSIVEGKPGSPNAVNPSIDQAMMALLGKCLFKDPFKRVKEARLLADDVAKFDPEAARFAVELASRVVAAAPPPAPVSTKRHALLLIADVPRQEDVQAAARLQLLIGEAVFLFDGTIVDPFSARLVAEMPSVDSALEAARKVEFDLVQSGTSLPVRLILHAGEVETKDGELVGDGVTKGLEVVQQVPPLKLLITEAFVKDGRGNARLRDAGARAGVKLYEIVPPEPEVPPITTDELEQIAAEEAEREKAEMAAAAAVVKSRRRTLAVALIALAVLAILGGAALKFRGRKSVVATATHGPAVTHAAVLGPATAASPRKVFLQLLPAPGSPPDPRAEALRITANEVLRSYPELRVVDGPAADVTTIDAMLPAPGGPPSDAASVVQSIVQQTAAKVQMAPPLTAPQAINAFADAVAASEAKDDARTEAALRAAIKADPNFLPAQRMAMNFFTLRGKDKDAIEAARQIVALEPGNLEAARALARASLRGGDVVQAFNAYSTILKKDRSDSEALNAFGRYAAGAADTAHFQTALTRLRGVPPRQVEVHEPDILVATGRLEQAVDRYYDIEVNVPDNPALSLKIGRIAVLRRTIPIAELELGKLQKNDPEYGYHLLKAYIAAQAGDRAGAGNELDAARAGSRSGDDYWTSAAEVYSLMADNARVIAALENAASRKEPTTSYVLTNPLFAYLASDARFQKVRQSMAANQQEIQSALGNVL